MFTDNVAPVSSTCWPLTDSASISGNCKNETEKYFLDENVLRRCSIPLFCYQILAHFVSRTPSCFLLIGGIVAALSLLGLLLVTEPDQDKGKQQEQREEELPSLNAREVLQTPLFYKVRIGHHHIFVSTVFICRYG